MKKVRKRENKPSRTGSEGWVSCIQNMGREAGRVGEEGAGLGTRWLLSYLEVGGPAWAGTLAAVHSAASGFPLSHSCFLKMSPCHRCCPSGSLGGRVRQVQGCVVEYISHTVVGYRCAVYRGTDGVSRVRGRTGGGG